MSGTGTGSDLAGKAAGGRKLIAVVYADMAGYSRLIALDDAGTLQRLRCLRRTLIEPAINEHGGTLVQTGGDSLLVAFDSIDGAVRFAVKVQRQVPTYDGEEPPERHIRFRIGVNIGDVLADVAPDRHGDRRKTLPPGSRPNVKPGMFVFRAPCGITWETSCGHCECEALWNRRNEATRITRPAEGFVLQM